MIGTLISSVQSEWLKTKRSLTAPLVLGAACFTPLVILVVRLMRASYRTSTGHPTSGTASGSVRGSRWC